MIEPGRAVHDPTDSDPYEYVEVVIAGNGEPIFTTSAVLQSN
jgi:ABC-type oligopeptide transport system substrate-binding subunit